MVAETPIQTYKEARRVFILTLLLNLLVSGSEMGWGYYTHTLSLTADGFHSLLDAGSNVIGIAALSVAIQPADSGHPYGHRKFEAMGAMLISFFIFMTCFHIAGEAFHRFMANDGNLPEVTPVSYLVKLFGLACNLFVIWYETKKGRELNNQLLLTDSKHTYSDILVSFSVLFSLAIVQMGWLWLDTVMAMIITVIIFKVGYEIIVEHLGILVDEARVDPEEVRAIVAEVPGVRGCHKIRSRGMPDHVFIDLHIQVEPTLTIREAHQISYQVESALERAFEGKVADVLVHVEEDETAETP